MEINKKHFNLIGFNFTNASEDPSKFKHCHIHVYKRLLESKTDPSLLYCPECGSEYPVNQAPVDQGIQAKFSGT